MKQPMTTIQATENHLSESDTCSMLCTRCNNRIWFNGSWNDDNTPDIFDCPYCAQPQINWLRNVQKKYKNTNNH